MNLITSVISSMFIYKALLGKLPEYLSWRLNYKSSSHRTWKTSWSLRMSISREEGIGSEIGKREKMQKFEKLDKLVPLNQFKSRLIDWSEGRGFLSFTSSSACLQLLMNSNIVLSGTLRCNLFYRCIETRASVKTSHFCVFSSAASCANWMCCMATPWNQDSQFNLLEVDLLAVFL